MQFLHDVLPVSDDSSEADVQVVGNLLVDATLGQEDGDLGLAWRQQGITLGGRDVAGVLSDGTVALTMERHQRLDELFLALVSACRR